MRPQDIYNWLRREPFVPFRISLSNGRQFDIRNPGMVLVGRSELVVGDQDPDFPVPVYDTASFVALMHINHIEPLPATSPPATA